MPPLTAKPYLRSVTRDFLNHYPRRLEQLLDDK
jgi:hypothetical protein